MTDLNNDVPKYIALYEELKNEMIEGQINYGDKILSENTLADIYKLSRHTVRQALAKMANEGWINKEQGKGTFCSYVKHKGNGKTVAVLTTYISDYIFPKIISGIEEVLSYNGYSMILANTKNNKENEEKYINNLINQNILGIIIEPTKSALENINVETLNRLKEKNIKLVYINSFYKEPEASYLIMDDEKGEYIATKYLIDIGHRKIAGIFKHDDIQGINRQKGFLKALSDNKIDINNEFLCRYDTNQKNILPYYFIKKIIESKNRPTAIICYNDEIALKVINAISDAGLVVPDDISVVGCDDSSLSLASQIKLTTIKHPKKEMGKQAAQFIIDMIENGEDNPSIIYEPELVVRNSCKGL